MATSSSKIFAGKNLNVFQITATADADTTIAVNHFLGVVPFIFFLTPILQAPAGLSLWAITAQDANTITLTKSTAVGSGNAGAQVQLTVIAKEAFENLGF